MPGQVKAAFEISTATFGVLSGLGLPVDFFADDDEVNVEALINDLEDTIEDGFFSNVQNQSILAIGTALQLSSQAWAEFKNDGLTVERKEALLQNAANGLTNMNTAIDTLLKIDGTLTPVVVQEIFTALSFSMTVLIRTATTLASGEKTAMGYNHGGVITYASQISSAIDHLESARDLFKEEYPLTVNELQSFVHDINPEGPGFIFKFRFIFTHNIALENNLALEFWSYFLTAHFPLVGGEGLDFTDPDILNIYENQVWFVFPATSLFQQPGPFYLERMENMAATIDDAMFFYLTGVRLPREAGPNSGFSHSLIYDANGDVFGDLIAAAKATIDGEVVTYDGAVREQAEQGTAGGGLPAGQCVR